MNTSIIKKPVLNNMQKYLPAKVKPLWKDFSENNNSRVFENYKIKNDIFGNLDVGIKKHKDGYDRWIIEIKNSLNKLLGKEIFDIDKNNKIMTGFFITVEPEYRRKHHFGELLRIFSVMEMLENKCSKIEIYSKDTAIYFHSKYKFVPNNTSFEERNKMLDSIIKNTHVDFKDLAEKAKHIKKEINSIKNNAQRQRELCVDTNKLAKDYIERALKKGKKAEHECSFNSGMTMILTKENILKNKNFFNKLFEKYRIDYTI